MSTFAKKNSNILDILAELSFLSREPYVEDRWMEIQKEIETKLNNNDLLIMKEHVSNLQSLKQKQSDLSFTSKTFELFKQINMEITSIAPLESILSSSANRLREISKAGIVLIALLNKNNNKIQVQVSSGTSSDAFLNFEQDLEFGVAGLVAKYKKPIIISNYKNQKELIDPLARLLIDEEGICSIIGAPFLVKEELIGIIFLARRHPYSSSKLHIRMLSTYCDQVAIAINNARLYANELRISHLHKNIFEAALDHGYYGIIQKLANFIHKPILLIDEFGNKIEEVLFSESEDNTTIPFPDYSLIFGEIQLHSKSIILQTRFVLSLNNAQYTVFPVLLSNRPVAYLVTPQSLNNDDHLSSMAIEQSKNILALKIAQERTSTEVEIRLRQDFIYDLIFGLESEEDLIRRGRYLKIHFQKPHHILLLSPSDPLGGSDGSDKQIIQALEKIRNKLGLVLFHLSMVHGRKLIVITSTDQTRKIAKDILDFFHQYCPSTDAMIGISNIVKEPKSYAKGYDEAKKAAEFANLIEKKNQIVHFDELGIIGLLFETENYDSMKTYCDKYLGSLIKYDSKNKTELLQSLEAFLEHESVIQTASESLHVHYNTLRYRLNRIEEITGLDLSNSQNRLNLRISFMIYHILGLNIVKSDEK